MSLDDSIAGPNQSVENPLGEGGDHLHDWLFKLKTFRAIHGDMSAAIAAQRTSLSAETKMIIPFVVAVFLASWLAIAILVGDGTNFPIPLESRRASSGLVALIPFLIAVIALFASKNLRDQYSNAERLADRHS